MKIIDFNNFVPARDSELPLHIQLRNELLRQLRALPANEKYALPSERSLVNSFQINRATIHRAYAELLDSGLVERNPDKSLTVSFGARKLLRGPFPTIGLLIPCRFSDYVESRYQRSFQYLKGIFDQAEKRNISILTLQLPPPDSSPETIRAFIEERCSLLTGLIHLGARTHNEDRALAEILNYRDIPQIFISGTSPLPHPGSVCSDPASGAEELASEARRLKFRTFGMLYRSSYESKFFRYAAIHRMPAIKKALLDAGLTMNEKWCVRHDSDDFFDPAPLPANGDLPDLIWCSSDTIATGLAKHLKKQNIRVPEDVSIVGFNGFFNTCAPEDAVATIGHPFYRMGEKAVDLLMEYFEHGMTGKNRHVLLKTRLIPGPTLRTEPLKNNQGGLGL